LIELTALQLRCPNCTQRQCEGPIQPWLDILDEETGEVVPISGCPYATLPMELAQWFPWYARWQKGLMPAAGGLLDQSAKYIEVMEYIDGLMARKAARDADDRRARAHPALP